MKAYTINCPSCGANVNLEKDVPRCFCPYCGTQIIVDDGVQRSEVVYRDEAKILELQLQEQARLRAIKEEQRRQKEFKQKQQRKIIRFLVIVAVYAIACAKLGMTFEKEQAKLDCYILSFIIPFFYPYKDDSGRGGNILMYFFLWFLVWLIGRTACVSIGPLIF